MDGCVVVVDFGGGDRGGKAGLVVEGGVLYERYGDERVLDFFDAQRSVMVMVMVVVMILMAMVVVVVVVMVVMMVVVMALRMESVAGMLLWALKMELCWRMLPSAMVVLRRWLSLRR